MGVGLEQQGYTNQAAVHYRVALAISPGAYEAHHNLGQLLRKKGLWDEAIKHYQVAIALNPKGLSPWLNLATAFMHQGRTEEAVAAYDHALDIAPDSTEALNNLAWLFAANCRPDIRNGPRAVSLGERACQLTQFTQTVMVGTLAAAYAEAGRFPEAIRTAEKAVARASATGDSALVAKNQELLALYRAGRPYHEEAPSKEQK